MHYWCAAGVGSAGQSGGAVVPGTDGAVAGVIWPRCWVTNTPSQIDCASHKPGWRGDITECI